MMFPLIPTLRRNMLSDGTNAVFGPVPSNGFLHYNKLANDWKLFFDRVVMTSLLRTLLLFVFALFWGGLTFYTGIAVRVAHDVLSDTMEGGLTTQRVTDWLQWFGVATVVLMVWNALVVRKSAKIRGTVLMGCAIILAIALFGLFVVHAQLDAVIDTTEREITDRDRFKIGHRRYNQLTTVEWLSALAYMVITVPAWRAVDRKDG